ncbi:hypothetical protein LIER_12824 [Lithospermum erythrorhizon]|uniref:Uncharacterized protein n=1 Tax=Lithospermum erythrorhizon TaxID=34254 RepID=A0AAV3PYE1_LITER
MDETENHADSSEEHPEEKIVQAVESSVLTISQKNEQECKLSKAETFTSSLKEDFLDDGEPERPESSVKERRLEEFFEEVDKFEYMDCREVDKSVEKQTTEVEMVKSESMRKRHSRRRCARTNIDFTEDRGGRMPRKEKEWKRTLACKLFEEKHSNNVEGSEDEEDEEEIDVHVCCLHAFKFSGGKMNMGVGGRNLARISKVVKEFRWFRSSVTKHGKKMNNNEEECKLDK